jgi:hypothetical protein
MTTASPWDIDNLKISHGKHDPPNGIVKACAMEAAYLRWAARQGFAKKKIVKGWTDSLACVCPSIGAFVRRWNDGIADSDAGTATRTRIFTPEVLDLLPETRGDDALLLRRMWMAIDWDVRTRTPAFLRCAKLEAQAVALESLPEIRSQEGLANARAACEDARRKGAAAGNAAGNAAWVAAGNAARAAARAAAGDAAGNAAWVAAWVAARVAAGNAAWAAAGDAAGDAAWDAAWDAARAAARDAARAAARAAAWVAARAAARDAARDALKPTVEAMQTSAVDLLRRMCAAK